MGLTIERVRRLGGAAGIMFVVLALVAFLLPGTPPTADDSAAEVTRFFTDKRDEIVYGNFILGVGTVFFFLFLGSLRASFGAGDRDGIRPGAIALAGGVAGTVLLLAGVAVFNGAAFRVAGQGDPTLNLALHDTANALFFMAAFGLAAFFVGAAMATRATGALPAWLAPAGYVVALLQVVSAVGLFAKSGFFAIGGAFGFIALLAALLWTLAASIALLRPVPAAAGGAPSAAGSS